MNYRGHNALGVTLSADEHGEARDRLLSVLERYRAAAEGNALAASAPIDYRRHRTAADCAAACLAVVKEFHAVCHPAAAGREG